MTAYNEWTYTGDVNIEYGGLYTRWDSNLHYCDAVRISDLAGGCGADGLVMIERLTTWVPDSAQKTREYLRYWGMDIKDLRGMGKNAILHLLAECAISYGWSDPVNDFTGPHRWILVTQDYSGDKRSWDGWEVDIKESVKLAKVYNHNLRDYIESEWM